MVEEKWNCNECGNSLESELEPQKCPCGSDDIEAREQLSMLERMLENFLNTDDKKAKS